MRPLGCFPLWGSEGVTLQAAAENKQILKKRGFLQSRIFCYFLTPLFFLNSSDTTAGYPEKLSEKDTEDFRKTAKGIINLTKF